MPQIGWLEILSVVIVAILVLGPKEFPIALKKIGTYIGKLKNTLSNFQKEVSSATDEMNFDEEVVTKDIQIKKDTKKPTIPPWNDLPGNQNLNIEKKSKKRISGW